MSVSLKDEVYAFEIDASEAGEGFIRVNIKGKLAKNILQKVLTHGISFSKITYIDPEKKDILPEIIQLADRKYTVQFQPHKIGKWKSIFIHKKIAR